MNGGHETRHHSVWKKWKIKIIYRPLCRDDSFTFDRHRKQSWKLLKIKIQDHFQAKKTSATPKLCKRNFFLMHHFPDMNFFSLPDLLGKGRFCSKIDFNCNILQNKVCIGYIDGSGQLLTFTQKFLSKLSNAEFF